MKKILLLGLLTLLWVSCKNDSTAGMTDAQIVAHKIAEAHGIDNWKMVNSLKFTFMVDRTINHTERTWIWEPKNNTVTLMTAEDTVHYNRKSMDSLAITADQGFINDAYWLLAPYHLVWDKATTLSIQDSVLAPLSQELTNKITIVYDGDAGGYTPGDAYDFFYDKDYKIKEWIYRKSNQPNPGLITTWENYEIYNGLHISHTHKTGDGGLNIHFKDIEVH